MENLAKTIKVCYYISKSDRKGYIMAKNSGAEYEGRLTENLKKGLTEMLVLSCLNKRPMHIYEILKLLDEKSNSVCKIAYPYAVIYRLQDNEFIADDVKKVSDNRLRVYYKITDKGKAHLDTMKKEYTLFLQGIDKILGYLENSD